MADKQLADLTATTELAGTDLLFVETSAGPRKITAANATTELSAVTSVNGETGAVSLSAAAVGADAAGTAASAVAAAASSYATAAQGTKADTAVQPTLVDAKGDLLVGSAADTLARLPVGTNDYVLTADSAEATGVKWAAASGGGGGGVGSRHWASSGGTQYWLFPGCNVRGGRNDSFSVNQSYYTPWVLDADRTLSAAGITVTTGGAGTVRLAIYNADEQWQPTTLVADLGNVSVASTGLVTITGLSVAMPAGRYLAGINTGVACSILAFIGQPNTGFAVNNSNWASNPGPYYFRLTSQNLGGGGWPSTGVGWNDAGSSGISDHMSLHVGGQFSA